MKKRTDFSLSRHRFVTGGAAGGSSPHDHGEKKQDKEHMTSVSGGDEGINIFVMCRGILKRVWIAGWKLRNEGQWRSINVLDLCFRHRFRVRIE